MGDFQSAVIDTEQIDPLKRVNYSFGLVLGVDEFLQEQTHLLEKHRRHNRRLHGYGTVCGLKVSVPTGVTPVEVRVAPGLAVTRGGAEVCVPRVMCAKLDDWLKANDAVLRQHVGVPPTTVTVCVVLCYRECATDIVPIPGEPCRSEEDAMAASRVAESFEIKLCLHDDVGSPPFGSPPFGSPPITSLSSTSCACASLTIRAAGEAEMGHLLRRIKVSLVGTPTPSQAAMEAATRAILAAVPGGPVSTPPSTSTLLVRPKQARDMLAAVSRVWTTEVLPELLRRDGESACGGPSPDACVQLATLRLDVAANGKVNGGAAGVKIDETERPILLDTSLLQEWLWSGGPSIVP